MHWGRISITFPPSTKDLSHSIESFPYAHTKIFHLNTAHTRTDTIAALQQDSSRVKPCDSKLLAPFLPTNQKPFHQHPLPKYNFSGQRKQNTHINPVDFLKYVRHIISQDPAMLNSRKQINKNQRGRVSSIGSG